MSTPQQQAAAAQLAAAALKSCAKTQFPFPEIQVAMAIFESGWLTKAPQFNCLGIKHHGNLPWQLIPTHEWFTGQQAAHFLSCDRRRTCELVQPLRTGAGGVSLYAASDLFCAYDGYEECFTDQARNFLMGGLTGSAAWAQFRLDGDREAYVRAIAAHYSTSPGYADQILAEADGGTVKAALRAIV